VSFVLHPRAPVGVSQAVGLAVLAMIAIQLAAALSRPLVAEIGAPTVTWIRMSAAAAALLVTTRPKLRGLARRSIAAAFMLGASLAVMAVAYFAAVSRLPLGMVSTIAFLGPLAVAVFGAHGWRPVALALMATIGVVLAIGALPSATDGGWTADPLGVVLAFIAAIAFAGYIVLLRRVGTLFSGSDGLTLSLLTAAVLLTPFGIVELDRVPSLPVVLGSVGLAVLAPLLTCWAEMTALRRLGTQSFSILISMEPAIAATLGLVLLHEVPNLMQAVGMILIILASIETVRMSARALPPENWTV
jgi:inner membrane transporter RhtA